MSDIVDTLELMAHNYAYAARKLILLDASAEIQSLRMQKTSLNKRAEEAERRVRWLEDRIEKRAMSMIGEEWLCGFCSAPDSMKHKDDCAVFDRDGKLKPTPEDFK